MRCRFLRWHTDSNSQQVLAVVECVDYGHILAVAAQQLRLQLCRLARETPILAFRVTFNNVLPEGEFSHWLPTTLNWLDRQLNCSKEGRKGLKV